MNIMVFFNQKIWNMTIFMIILLEKYIKSWAAAYSIHLLTSED